MKQILFIVCLLVLTAETAFARAHSAKPLSEYHNSTIYPAPTTLSPSVFKTNLQGYFRGNDGIVIYASQYQDEIFWFGENPETNLNSHVFSGKITGNKLIGYFFSLPNSKYHGKGKLEFEIENNGQSFKRIKGNYYTKTLTRTNVRPSLNKLPSSLNYSQLDNREVLDGIWTTENGLKYQVRQCGSRIAFFGEKPSDKFKQPDYSVTAVGRRVGDVITVNWGQLPHSTTRKNGRASFRVRNANEITRFSGKGFLGTTLNRLQVDNANSQEWDKKLNGVYLNSDSKSNGIVKLNFHGKQGQVEIWGSCQPTACYWGAMFFKTDESGLTHVEFNSSFSTRHFEIEKISGTRIKMQQRVVYKDHRKNRYATFYFDKRSD